MTNALTTSVSDIFRRPADDNYGSMDELLKVSEEAMNQSRQFRVKGMDLSFGQTREGDALTLIMDGHSPLPLVHWSLTQSAKMAKLPIDVIERLYKAQRLDLVVDNMNTLFPPGNYDEKLILVRDRHTDTSIDSHVRAVNGSAYSRLWDNEVFIEVDDWLIPRGFTPSLPAMRNGMRNGLMYGLGAGLFRGDQCSFGFFFAEKDMNGQSADLGGLQPGVMVWNSEVGARSFGFHTFYYHQESGSILVWTPANHKRKRFVHRGNIRKAFKEYLHTLEDVALKFEERYTKDVQVFRDLSYTKFAQDENAAIEKLKGSFGMSIPAAKAAVAASKKTCNQWGVSLSVWQIALGIAWEAGQTSRAESLVDDTLVATSVMRRFAAALKGQFSS